MTEIKENTLDKYVVSSKENYKPGKIDRMLIISRPGIGKTSALMELPNSIIFDLENSSGHFQGKSSVINIKDIMDKEGWGPITTLKRMTSFVKESKIKYRFCIIDTISMIDDWAESLALANYKATPMGTKSQIKSIFELEFGLGYSYHRNAFQEIIEFFEGIAETLILVAHIKDSSIKKSGETTSVIDVRLTGALREIISAKQDASCVMTFDKKEPSKRYLDFRKSEENVFMKCRVEHLSGTMVLISEKDESGEFITHWKDIFLDLK